MVDERLRDDGYWYPAAGSDEVVGLLAAVREFRRADTLMRRRLSADMDMNVSDLSALQYVVRAEREGRPATPRELTAHLGVSTASTTKLIDRLADSGHLARAPHPTDRRSVVLTATETAHEEIRRRLSVMHERMAAVAAAVPADERATIVDFLRAMADELDRAGRDDEAVPQS